MPPPFPRGTSLTISILDKSVLEVIPPALLITSEMVVRDSFDLLTTRSCEDWLFDCKFLSISDCSLFSINKSRPESYSLSNITNESLTTISDVIRKAGGITSKTDLSKIEIIRDIPLGKGGGKKRAFIDFNAYIYESDPTNDMRIFDGDTLFFPKLSKANPSQIPKSILSGISPKFISVNLYGRVENTGVIKLPLEATLSDAIDISGPVKPLSGKIVLIRYEKDGTVLKKNIAYSARAKRGSKRNPYLKEDDLISVKNSFYGKTAGVIGEFTSPFLGIYSTKELIDGFSD